MRQAAQAWGVGRDKEEARQDWDIACGSGSPCLGPFCPPSLSTCPPARSEALRCPPHTPALPRLHQTTCCSMLPLSLSCCSAGPTCRQDPPQNSPHCTARHQIPAPPHCCAQKLDRSCVPDRPRMRTLSSWSLQHHVEWSYWRKSSAYPTSDCAAPCSASQEMPPRAGALEVAAVGPAPRRPAAAAAADDDDDGDGLCNQYSVTCLQSFWSALHSRLQRRALPDQAHRAA
eukprot:1160366-Pelagomonas_calceolata.AAC.5